MSCISLYLQVIGLLTGVSNITTPINWIDLKFDTDINGPQRIHHSNFGDPLTFPLVPLLYHEVHICGFKRNVSTTIGWIVMTFGTDIMPPAG